LGPFKDYDKPFISSPKTDFPIDDHVEWYQNKKYYCIAKDHGDSLTKYGIALLLFESSNGYDWKLSDHPLVHQFSITFNDGETMEFDRLEMPKVYLENGKLKALFWQPSPREKKIHSPSYCLSNLTKYIFKQTQLIFSKGIKNKK